MEKSLGLMPKVLLLNVDRQRKMGLAIYPTMSSCSSIKSKYMALSFARWTFDCNSMSLVFLGEVLVGFLIA